jgi:two-component system KDP operon response regulator KdpE
MTSSVAQRAPRILLVEDDLLNRMLVRAVLSRSTDPQLRAACLVEAGDLAQARAALAGGRVDVVLLDLGLPDGSGLTLATELGNADGGQPVPVVAVTGDAAPEQARAAMAAGCRAVLVKPYAAAELRGVLGSLLRGVQAGPDHRPSPGNRRLPGPARPGPRFPARHVRPGDG